MRTADLDFELPSDLIASSPLAERDASRLLVLRRAGAELSDDAVRSLPALLPAGALLVVNDTRVIPARLRGVKASGGKAEFLLVRETRGDGRRWEALGRASKPLRDGALIAIGEGLSVRVLGRDGMMLDVELIADDPRAAIERHGEMPLPPYMHRAPEASDRERYQTVYANRPGAVAAPTAGLHLTDGLLAAIAARGIERALERFGLTPRAGDRVGTLSGGLRRRVELAKALLPEPPLLVLDEPSSGLDPTARRELLQELRRLRDDEGTTIVLTTHMMEEAAVSDRVGILHQGQLVAIGAPEDLVANVPARAPTLEDVFTHHTGTGLSS